LNDFVFCLSFSLFSLSFFYANDIFWIVTEQNNTFLFFYMPQIQGEEEIGHQGIFAGTTRNENLSRI
jgi:hypothetical protein